MPKLSKLQFAELVRSMPNASDDEILAAAKQKETEPEAPQSLAGKVWDFANKPLTDAPSRLASKAADEIDSPANGDLEYDTINIPGVGPFNTRGLIAGMTKGAGDVVSGLTSPLNLVMTALGLGGEAAGARGALGISRAARTAEKALMAPLAVEGGYNTAKGLSEGDLGKAGSGFVEVAGALGGMRNAGEHAFPPAKVREAYMKSKGRENVPTPRVEKINPEFSKQVADAYEAMPHDPQNPEVAAAYKAMADETSDQFAFLRDKAGVKMEPWTKEGQPYANSKEMMNDIQQNNRLFYFPSEAGFGEAEAAAGNPLLKPGKSGAPVNDEFRAAHDYFGHAVEGNQFGPLGEERAFQAHREMFPPEAIPALATETRGQNSWVNFGPHLRNEQGVIPKKGEPGFVAPQNRPFAEQKTGLLPAEMQRADASTTSPTPANERATKKSGSKGFTAAAIASPAAAAAIPDDPDSQVDDWLRLGLNVASVAGLGALGATTFRDMSRGTALSTLAAGQHALKVTPEVMAERIRQVIPDASEREIAKAIKQGGKLYEKALKDSQGQLENSAMHKELYNQGKGKSHWYEEGQMLFKEFVDNGLARPEDEKQFFDLLGAFGSQKPPKDNYRQFREVWEHLANGGDEAQLPIHPLTPGIDNVNRAIKGEPLSGRKINSYAENLRGNLEPSTNDRWAFRAFGLPGDKPNHFTDARYEIIDQLTKKYADEEGVRPAQFQAGQWAGVRQAAADAKAVSPDWKKPQQGYPMLQQHRLYEAEKRLGGSNSFKQVIGKAAKEINQISKNSVEALGGKEGGATFNLKDGNLYGTDHTSVSIFPERTFVVPKGKNLTDSHIQSFIMDNLDLLDNPHTSVGTWFDPEAGWTLDVVATPSNARPQGGESLGVSLGRKYNQKGVFDLSPNGGFVDTGGTGEAVEGLPHIYERLRDLAEQLLQGSRASQKTK